MDRLDRLGWTGCGLAIGVWPCCKGALGCGACRGPRGGGGSLLLQPWPGPASGCGPGPLGPRDSRYAVRHRTPPPARRCSRVSSGKARGPERLRRDPASARALRPSLAPGFAASAAAPSRAARTRLAAEETRSSSDWDMTRMLTVGACPVPLRRLGRRRSVRAAPAVPPVSRHRRGRRRPELAGGGRPCGPRERKSVMGSIIRVSEGLLIRVSEGITYPSHRRGGRWAASRDGPARGSSAMCWGGGARAGCARRRRGSGRRRAPAR